MSAVEKLTYYGEKGAQHLARICLSHRLALDGLSIDIPAAEARIADLIRDSFSELPPDALETKLRRGLHEVHLIALKADFELYLNRVLTVVWGVHFEQLAGHAGGNRSVSLKEMAVAVMDGKSREFVVAHAVPDGGLDPLVQALSNATGVQLPAVVGGQQSPSWSQVEVAFQVRNLIEHSDGKASVRFLRRVPQFWQRSSWGERGPLPGKQERVLVEEVDVSRTYEAMRDAVRLLTRKLVKWDSAQISAHRGRGNKRPQSRSMKESADG